MQQVLNSGNAKLKEYYINEINKYTQQTEQYKQKVEQNKKDIENYKKYLKDYEKDVEAYQKSIIYLYNPDNVNFATTYSLFRAQLKIMLDELQQKYQAQTLLYNAQKAKKLQEYENSTDYFQANEIKYKLVISFMPDGIPYYFTYETLASSYIKEDLDKQIQQIIDEQNQQKENESYFNTAGKENYENIVQRLRELNQQIEDNTQYLYDLEHSTTHQQIEQLQKVLDGDGTVDRVTYMQTYQQITDLQEEEQKQQTEIAYIKNYIEQLNEQYFTLSQQANWLEGGMNNPAIQQVAPDYQVYEDKKELENQLQLIEGQLVQINNLKKNQTVINRAIITTNQNYTKLQNECNQYFYNVQHLQQLKRYGADESEIQQTQTQIQTWYDHNNSKLNQLEIYKSNLQIAKNDYLNNSNIIASSKDLTLRKKAIQEQLVEIDEKIAALESPSIATKFTIGENGTAYELGYDFSQNSIYKNLYIDVQETNEWLDLKNEINTLYNNYDFYLPDEIEKPKEDDEKTLPVVNEDGEVELVEDSNKEGKCNWFIPLDYELFGVPSPIPFIPLTVTIIKKDQYGQNIPKTDKEGNPIPGEFETEKRQMAVQDGYGFIYTGQTITLYYTGVPITPPNISVMISGVGLEYGALLAGNYVALTPMAIHQLKKYPYQNTDPAGQFYWLQTGLIKDIMATIKGKFPIEITFKIYKKFPLACGFPKKCGVMSNEDFSIRGKCGLRQFFENTHDIATQFDQDSFDISEYLKEMGEGLIQTLDKLSEVTEKVTSKETGSLGPIIKKTTGNMLNTISQKTKMLDNVAEKAFTVYKKNFGNIGDRAAKFMQNKRNIAEWGNASLTIAQNTWNIGDAMSNITLTQETARQAAHGVIDKMRGQLYDLIPPECQQSICNTIKESKQDSIKNLGDTVKESTNTSLETLGNFIEKSTNNTFNQLKDSATKVGGGISATLNAAFQGLINFGKQFDFFSLTQYCPRRLSDVTKDINPIQGVISQLPNGDWQIPDSPDIFSQLGLVASEQIIGGIMDALNNCVTRSLTTNNINNSSLLPDGSRKYIQAANSVGDIANMARQIRGNKLTLNNLFHEGNRSSILANFADVDINNISVGYLRDELYERGINNIVDIDATLDKDSVIDSLKNTISRAVSNNNDIMDKLKNGQILSMNDQYKQLTSENLTKKTQQWSKNISDKINGVTSIGQKAKSLANTDLSQAWQNPMKTIRKLQDITNTMNSMMMKEMLQKKHKEDQMNAAFAESQQFKEVKTYGLNRYDYLKSLTQQDFEQFKERIDKL